MDLIEDLPDFQDLNPENSRGVLLNGAVSWKEWAYGGYGLMAGMGLCMTAQLLKGCARRPSFTRNAAGNLNLTYTNLGLTLKLVP